VRDGAGGVDEERRQLGAELAPNAIGNKHDDFVALIEAIPTRKVRGPRSRRAYIVFAQRPDEVVTAKAVMERRHTYYTKHHAAADVERLRADGYMVMFGWLSDIEHYRQGAAWLRQTLDAAREVLGDIDNLPAEYVIECGHARLRDFEGYATNELLGSQF
jgi:hypothetical protein